MAFQIPSLKELIERIAADVEDRLPGADARIRRTVESVLVRVFSAPVRGLHKHLRAVSLEILPSTATEGGLLPVHASAWDVPRQQPVQATGTVSGTVAEGSAATLPSGTEMQAADGTLFVTLAEAIGDGNDQLLAVPVRAVEAGTSGNLDPDTELTLTSPVSDVDSTFTVDPDGASNGTVGGLDLESIESWRGRILDRIRNPPSGGGHGDFVRWAKDIAGVTRAWEQANALGPGTVRVLFVRDLDGEGAQIQPNPDQVQEVQDYLQERDGNDRIIGGVAPIVARVTVVQPAVPLLNIEIDATLDTEAGLTEPEAEANIKAELVDMLFEFAEPGGTIRISQIREAISRAAGELHHTLTTPNTDQTYQDTEIPVLGTLTVNWQ